MSVTITQYGDYIAGRSSDFNLIDNYIYLYHTDTLIILPTFPESIADTMPASYTSTNILGRSAPIYAYSGSGPRSVDLRFVLHRDMMNQINLEKESYAYGLKFFQEDSDGKLIRKLKRADYVDLMINELQSIAFPSYAASQKMVDPPLVAVRIGDEIFCKGIVDGGVSVNFTGPILANPLYDGEGNISYQKDANGNDTNIREVGKGKYAMAEISFKVTEVDPYDASTVASMGSFRGINRTLEKNLYKVSI